MYYDCKCNQNQRLNVPSEARKDYRPLRTVLNFRDHTTSALTEIELFV
jgi:hypothetical protein